MDRSREVLVHVAGCRLVGVLWLYKQIVKYKIYIVCINEIFNYPAFITNVVRTPNKIRSIKIAQKKKRMDELRFYVPSTVFQSFRDDGRMNMKGSVQ